MQHMNKIGRLSTILLITIMCMPVIYQVLAIPQMPHQFYGSVTIAGEPAPDGTLVEAKINNVMYANTTTLDGKYGYSPVFYVPADDPETPTKEGGANGETVDFYVNGVYAASYTFQIGSVTRLDLAIIAPLPHADFTANATSGNEPLTIIFTDMSENFDSITSWNWNFGDGATSNLQNPTHTYEQNGTYTVSLTVVGIKNGETVEDTETKVDYIQVFDTNPVADFTATPTSGVAPLQVSFTDTSTSYDGIISWSWSFGDGGTSTEQNPTHVYETEGTYTVTLTVAEADGDTDSETKTNYITVTVVPPPTIVSFSPPYSPVTDVEGASRTFSITVDQLVNVTWLINGTLLSTVYNTMTSSMGITDAPLGIWNVSAVASNVNGTAMQTWIWNVTTALPPPHADFVANVTSGTEPLTVAFTDLSEYFGTITSWQWDFNNDGVIDSTEQNPVYTYVQNGTYTVTLTVVGELGTDTETKTNYIQVFDTDPVADFYATPTIGIKPLEVRFYPNCTSYDGIVSWRWNFGDGTNSTEESPVHTYTEVGIYTVTLTIREADGDTNSKTRTNYITVTAVEFLNIRPRADKYLRGDTISFYINSSEPIHIAIMIFDPTGYPASWIDLPQDYWWNVSGYWVIAYNYGMLTITSDAPLGNWNWKALEYNATLPSSEWNVLAAGTFTVESLTLEMILERLNEINATITDIQGDMVLIKTDLGTIKTDIGTVNSLIEGMNATLVTIQGDVAVIKTDVATIKVKLDAINATIVDIKGDVATIKTDLGTIKTDLDTIDAVLVGIDEGVAYIKTAIDDVELKLDSLDITAINATLVEIKDGLASINSKIGSIETSLTSINAKLVAFNGTIATISSDIGTIKVSIDNINLKVVAINGTVATIETDLGTIKGTITSIDGNVATIETDMGTLQTTLEDIKSVTGIVAVTWFAVAFSLIAAVFAIVAAALIWGKRGSSWTRLT
ncbi:MAG: PKD domain-containing protein [Candidatus Bathyarchaeaceae archaeon]